MGSLPGCPEPQHWLHPLPFSQHKCWLLLGTSPCSSCTEFFCYQTSWKPGDLQPCYHSNHSITRYVDDSAAKIMFYSRAQAKKKTTKTLWNNINVLCFLLVPTTETYCWLQGTTQQNSGVFIWSEIHSHVHLSPSHCCSLPSCPWCCLSVGFPHFSSHFFTPSPDWEQFSIHQPLALGASLRVPLGSLVFVPLKLNLLTWHFLDESRASFHGTTESLGFGWGPSAATRPILTAFSNLNTSRKETTTPDQPLRTCETVMPPFFASSSLASSLG